jgi:5-methylcytosine-specific restriction protein A
MRRFELSDRRAVVRAIAECDALGRNEFRKKYGFLPARWYLLVHAGKEYDSKAIFAAAYGFQYGTCLKASSFGGGLQRVRPVLEGLGFRVTGMESGVEFVALSEEVSGDLWEGARKSVQVNSYERNAAARIACIDHHGSRCCVCGFDFEAVYGAAFFGFIHAHHVTPMNTIDARYRVDPIKDLVPVCPNCHAIIHHGGHTRSIEEVRQLLRPKTPNPALQQTPASRRR